MRADHTIALTYRKERCRFKKPSDMYRAITQQQAGRKRRRKRELESKETKDSSGARIEDGVVARVMQGINRFSNLNS